MRYFRYLLSALLMLNAALLAAQPEAVDMGLSVKWASCTQLTSG